MPALAAPVETVELSKRYGDITALQNCTVQVDAGEVFGLLGPNGSGKSTFLRTLTGMVRPTHGVARIAGLDCWTQSVEVRRLTAYLPGDARLFRWLRGRDVLDLLASARADGDLPASLKLAKRLDLDLRRRVALMSTGMRQKLALAAVLATPAPVVILDEPTANLDPSVRMEVLQLVREARNRGQTVLFSSHVLSEVEEICQRVLLLHKGRVAHLQDMSQLRSGHRIIARLGGQLPAAPAEIAAAVAIHEHDGEVWIDAEGELPTVLNWLAVAEPGELRVEPLGLRTIYEEHFGRASVEEEAP